MKPYPRKPILSAKDRDHGVYHGDSFALRIKELECMKFHVLMDSKNRESKNRCFFRFLVLAIVVSSNSRNTITPVFFSVFESTLRSIFPTHSKKRVGTKII
jgi:hypothetical protein